MEALSSCQFQPNKINETNNVKLFLEASINRKVEKCRINFFDVEKLNIKELMSKNQHYKVWLYDKNVLKDANSALNKNEIHPGKSTLNFPKSLKFKVGPIDYKLLKEQNKEFYQSSTNPIRKLESSSITDKLCIVLALVLVGRPATYLIEDSVDIERISEHNLNSITNSQTLKGQQCVYFCRNNPKGSFSTKYQNNSNNSLPNNQNAPFGDHYYATNEYENIIYLSVINFTCDSENIQCAMCNIEPKQYERFLYCHNDKKYFCPSCDDDYHVKTKHKLFQKHKRTVHMSFSMINQDLCEIHTLKQLEFYCLKCRAVYCIKCVTEGEHKDLIDHEVKYLNEVFSSFDQESKSLLERTRQFIYQATADLVENDKSSKETQKLVKELDASALDKKQKMIEEVELESLSRIIMLTSVASELQRLISEVDYKNNFLKNAYLNGDHSTYIAMINSYSNYFKRHLSPQIDIVVNTDNKRASEHIIPEQEEYEKKRKQKIKFLNI